MVWYAIDQWMSFWLNAVQAVMVSSNSGGGAGVVKRKVLR